jgi:putative hemolysin
VTFSLSLPRRIKPRRRAEPVHFSFSRPEHSIIRRTLIHMAETMSGQPRLKRLYYSFHDNPLPEENFFEAAVRLLEIDIICDRTPLARIPASGPVIFVANHPFGVLDGILLGRLISLCRPDFKLLVHSLLCQPPELRDFVLPIDFGNTLEARATTLRTRSLAASWLRDGHAIGVFPGGSVATSETPFGSPAVDPAWHPFVAKLVLTSQATIVPIYFAGQNSRLFQIASHWNYTARLSLLFRETARKVGTRVEMAIGEPINAATLCQLGDRRDILRELRKRTLALAEGLGHDPPDYRREFSFPARISFD